MAHALEYVFYLQPSVIIRRHRFQYLKYFHTQFVFHENGHGLDPEMQVGRDDLPLVDLEVHDVQRRTQLEFVRRSCK